MVKALKKTGGIFSVIDLNDYGLGAVPAERRNEVKKDVGEYLLSQIKKSARNITSPVSGESWKSTLSKDYRQEKMARGGGSSANLRLTGSLMNSLTYKLGPGGQVLVGNKSGGRNDRKSIGHNHFEPRAKSPRRRFLPNAGQKFKQNIESGIKDIVKTSQELDFDEVGLDLDVAVESAVGSLSEYQQSLLATLADDDLAGIL